MSGVQEFFSIVPWTIIFQFCNLLILCLLIKKFLFQRVMLVLDQRQKEVDNIYAAANEDRDRAAELKQNYDLRMAGAREEADQLMKKTVASANLRSDAIIDDAQKQAANMMRRAESEIAQERVKAFAEVKKEISVMAVDIAEQMVSREIKAADHAELVDEFIRKAGEDA